MPADGMIASQGAVDRYAMHIGGRWTSGTAQDWIAVDNPTSEEVFAEVPDATAEDAEAALEAARDAQTGWAATPPVERAKLLYRLGQAANAEKDRLARLIVAEQGKPFREALGEVGAIALYLDYAAEAARRLDGDIVAADTRGEELWIRRVPHGVVVALTAWNYPLGLAARKLGPALVTGNTVVLKPHEMTPVSSLELARIAAEVGFPAGVINVVTGRGRTTGAALVSSKNSDLVTMTGSLRAGREIYAAGADQIKVIRLELGGKAPFIVMEDADLDRAVDAAIISRFTNCGQICTCNERMYLHEAIADAFLEKFLERVAAIRIGDPMDDPDMGPKISRQEVEKVDDVVTAAKAAGARVLAGGERLSEGTFARGHWYAPTVLDGLGNDAAVFQEEIFGPVVPVMRVGSFEEAIQLANQSHYGLSAYIFTRDFKRIMRLGSELSFSELYINRPCGELVQGFHNGWRQSGLGGEDGKYGIDGYLRKKAMYVNWS